MKTCFALLLFVLVFHAGYSQKNISKKEIVGKWILKTSPKKDTITFLDNSKFVRTNGAVKTYGKWQLSKHADSLAISPPLDQTLNAATDTVGPIIYSPEYHPYEILEWNKKTLLLRTSVLWPDRNQISLQRFELERIKK